MLPNLRGQVAKIHAFAVLAAMPLLASCAMTTPTTAVVPPSQAPANSAAASGAPATAAPPSTTAPAQTCADGVQVPAGVSAPVCAGEPAGATPVGQQNSGGTEWYVFTTPSDNIQCQIEDAGGNPGVECVILSKTFPDPPKQLCDDEVANNVWDGAAANLYYTGPAEKGLCRIKLGPIESWDGNKAPQVAYGETVMMSRVACSSAEDGLTCWNTSTHHGFKLSETVQLAW